MHGRFYIDQSYLCDSIPYGDYLRYMGVTRPQDFLADLEQCQEVSFLTIYLALEGMLTWEPFR